MRSRARQRLPRPVRRRGGRGEVAGWSALDARADPGRHGGAHPPPRRRSVRVVRLHTVAHSDRATSGRAARNRGTASELWS